MRIQLSNNHNTFEADVEPSATILDIKNLIVDLFGYPEEATKRIKLIYKKVVQRDESKTLLDINVTDGSAFFYYVPNVYSPTKNPPSSSIGKIQPKSSSVQQNSTEPQNIPNPNQNPPKSPEPINKPEAEPYFPSLTPQQPTQPIKEQNFAEPINKPETEPYFPTQTPQQPLYSQIPPQNTTEDNFFSSFQHSQESSALSQPSAGIQNPFMNYFNQSNQQHDSVYPQADPNKIQQLLEMGYDERHARAFLRGSFNNTEYAFELMSSKFYQNEYNFDRYERLVNGELSKEETKEFNRDYLNDFRANQKEPMNPLQTAMLNAMERMCESSDNDSNNNSSLFNTQNNSLYSPQNNGFLNPQNNSNPLEQLSNMIIQQQQQRQNAINQFQNMLRQYQQQSSFSNPYTNIFNQPLQNSAYQFQNPYQQMQNAEIQKGKKQINYLTQAIQKMQLIKNQSPEQFVNPFIEIYQNLVRDNMIGDDFYKSVEVASRFNREQILFMLEYAKTNDFNYIVSIINASDGNLDNARAMLGPH